MSLAWIILLGLLISERNTSGALVTTSPHHRLRGTHLPAIKVHDVAQRTSRRIVRITGSEKASTRPPKIQHVEAFNDSVSTSNRSEYNMWQVLRVDGKTNLYILFFTIYISYLVYVLF
ncbi:uncharacterized protein [Drosophila takahashii]|uniref:uncharacterized protein n=1 Tax=Drosophila takahashii TaxID=29030 RepID=UPI001CF91E55|nr:uncharacterized protein LOC108057946 [Drosophila takahashii]